MTIAAKVAENLPYEDSTLSFFAIANPHSKSKLNAARIFYSMLIIV